LLSAALQERAKRHMVTSNLPLDQAVG